MRMVQYYVEIVASLDMVFVNLRIVSHSRDEAKNQKWIFFIFLQFGKKIIVITANFIYKLSNLSLSLFSFCSNISEGILWKTG